MHIGVVKFSIRLPGNSSLKGKRSIVRSLCQKLRNQFEVSVAEVERNDDLRTAVIGISFVSNDSQVIQGVIAHILKFLQQYVGDFILEDFHQDVLSGL